MKNTVLSIAILMAACFSLNAQEQEFEYKGAARPDLNEFNFSYGTPTAAWVVTLYTLPFAETLFETLFSIFMPLGVDIPSYSVSTGSFGVEYMRYLKSGRVAFGGLLCYENLMLRNVDKKDPSKNWSENTHLMTVMPSIKVAWFNRKHFGMYTRAAIGVTAIMGKNRTIPYLALQVSAVGMDFGGRRCRGFLEYGFGTQGIFVAGVKTCF